MGGTVILHEQAIGIVQRVASRTLNGDQNAFNALRAEHRLPETAPQHEPQCRESLGKLVPRLQLSLLRYGLSLRVWELSEMGLFNVTAAESSYL